MIILTELKTHNPEIYKKICIKYTLNEHSLKEAIDGFDYLFKK